MSQKNLIVRFSTRDSEVVRRALTNLGDEGQKALSRIERASKGPTASMRAMDAGSRQLQASFRSLAIQMAAAFSVREIIRMSDTYSLLQGKLKLVTNSSEELALVQQRLFKLAQENRTSYEATVTLYQRLAQSAGNLGTSQQQLLDLTNTVSKALRVGGATAQEASAGVIQLSQALASGTLRGDEFRSVLENMPRVAMALEQALGVTRGELIEMAKQGQLTSKQVADALLDQSEVIETEYGKLPKTVGESFTQLGNSLTQFTGQNGAARAAVQGLADSLSWLSQMIDELNERANKVYDFTHTDVVSGLLSDARRDLAVAQSLGHTEIAQNKLIEIQYLENRLKQVQEQDAARKQRQLDSLNVVPPSTPTPSSTEMKAAEKIADRRAKLLREINDLERENAAFAKGGADEAEIRRKLNDFIAKTKGLRKDEIELLSKQYEQQLRIGQEQEEQAKALKKAQEEQKRAIEKAQREYQRIYEHTAERIQDAFADSFTDIFENGVTSFSDLAKQVKSIMLRMAAEVAAAMIFKPVVGSVFGSVMPGFSGSAGGAGGSVAGGSLGGTGSMVGGLGSAYQFLTGGAHLGGTFVNAGQMLGLGGIDNAAKLYSIGSNFTPAAGLAGFGGSMLANALFGNRGMGATVGGTLGGFAGTAMGGQIASLLGISAGLGGPLGAFVGTVAGNLIGGMFGGKKHPGASFQTDLTAAGGFTDPILLSKHMTTEGPEAALNQMSAFLAGLQQIYGTGSLQAGQIQGIFGSDGMGRLAYDYANDNIGPANFGFDAGSDSSFLEAMRRMALYMAQTADVVNDELVTALSNMTTEGRTAADALADLTAKMGYAQGLSTLADSLKLNPATSNLSPEAFYQEMRSALTSTLSRADAGEATLDEISAAVASFLGASQAYAGRASGLYADDLSMTQSRLQQLADAAPRFARGGDFSRGMFVTHPGEIVMTSQTPGRVLNARETQQLLGGSGLSGELVSLLKGLIAQVGNQTMVLQKELAKSREDNAGLQKQLARVTAA